MARIVRHGTIDLRPVKDSPGLVRTEQELKELIVDVLSSAVVAQVRQDLARAATSTSPSGAHTQVRPVPESE